MRVQPGQLSNFVRYCQGDVYGSNLKSQLAYPCAVMATSPTDQVELVEGVFFKAEAQVETWYGFVQSFFVVDFQHHLNSPQRTHHLTMMVWYTHHSDQQTADELRSDKITGLRRIVNKRCYQIASSMSVAISARPWRPPSSERPPQQKPATAMSSWTCRTTSTMRDKGTFTVRRLAFAGARRAMRPQPNPPPYQPSPPPQPAQTRTEAN